MKSYVITIAEVDDKEFALEELEAQLADIAFCKNTVGIVTVSLEFLDSGVYPAIAAAVPFPLIGMSTHTQNANGQIGTFLFSILVLTSDTCEFAYGSSGVLPDKGDVADVTRECYQDIKARLAGEPKLAFLYAPFMLFQSSPHKYINAISAVDGRVPVFGSLAAASVARLTAGGTKTVCGEQTFGDRLVILLISGDISPEFYVRSVTDMPAVLSNVGEVTASEDNFVMEINHTRINDVFAKIGFNLGATEDEGAVTSVFIINKKDEDGRLLPSAARACYLLDDGVGVFGGHIPTGSVLSLVVTTKDMLAATAKDIAARIKKEHRGKTMLFYCCMGRQIALLDEPMLEYEIIQETFKDSGVNYIATSSGGEICPASVMADSVCNSEHNSSIIVCVF